MANLILIAAVGENNELGKNNQLIWHLKKDMIFFKENTLNHKVVMGYKTYLSLPKLLSNRQNIVLTHQDIDIKGAFVFHSQKELLIYLNSLQEEDVYIIGGATIYKAFLPYANILLLTEIKATCKEADTYFPRFNLEDYEKINLASQQEDNLTFNHVKYVRKKKIQPKV